MKQEDVDLSIAHIQEGEDYFQVLNEDGTDWDESATKAAYQVYLDSK